MWLILSLFFVIKFSEFETIVARRRTSANPADRKSKATTNDFSLPIDVLGGFCFDTFQSAKWWTYVWCYKLYAKQVHLDPSTRVVQFSNEIGRFEALLSTSTLHVYRSVKADCYLPVKNRHSKRSMKINIKCCDAVTVANFRRFDTANLYEMKHRTFITSITEPSGCNYIMHVCSEHVCSPKLTPTVKIEPLLHATATSNTSSSVSITRKQQLMLRERVRGMFFHAYRSYVDNAFPSGELKPISCTGGHFEMIKLPAVTLIDTLDTLVVMGEFVEFRSAVNMVSKQIRSFDFDINVSLFETTIRLLGGLLSAHLFAVDPRLRIYQHVNRTYTQLYINRNYCQIQGEKEDTMIDEDLKELEYKEIYENDYAKNELKERNSIRKRLIISEPTTQFGWPWKDSMPVSCQTESIEMVAKDSDCAATYYDNWLLTLAVDLGERLLPAFETQTGIPYGTVNLRYGVPKGETDVASTAGAGSLSVEFEILSRLTGNLKYRDVAFNASKELFRRRSIVGLLGKHINTRTGGWVENSSGIGSNSDSYYEYLLKTYLLFGNSESYKMFAETYFAVKRHVQLDDWFGDVDMNNPKTRRNRVESLHCFWPGMEASLGLRDSSTKLLNAFFAVWNAHGFFPEEFDQVAWLNSLGFNGNGYYPLRPELIESTYYHYTVAGDRSWLTAGKLILDSIQKHSHTKCGYASISNLVDKKLRNEMQSFFLSETCKYLYLLFDEANFIHDRSYIFSTEAHPFDTVQLPPLAPAIEYSYSNTPSENSIVQSRAVNRHKANKQLSETVHERRPPYSPPRQVNHNDLVQFLADKKNYYTDVNVELSLTCPKRLYWDNDVSYNNLYFFKQATFATSDIDTRTKLLDKFDSITQMLDELNKIGLDTSIEQAKLADLVRRTRKPVRRQYSNKCYSSDQRKST